MRGRERLLVPLAAFLVGGLCGWGLHPNRPVQIVSVTPRVLGHVPRADRPSTPTSVEVTVEPVFEPAVTEPAAVARHRQGAAPTVTVEAVQDEETGLSMHEARAKFLRDHPEAAAAQRERLVQRLAEVRQERESRSRFFAAIDDSFLSADQRGRHDAFRRDLARTDQLLAKADELRLTHEDLSRAEVQELIQAKERLREGVEGERVALLEAAARSAGFEGDAAKDFAGLLTSIFEMTRAQQYR